MEYSLTPCSLRTFRNSGQIGLCRLSYSSWKPGLTVIENAFRIIPHLRALSSVSKIEAIDVLLVEDEWRSQPYLVICNLNLAQLAGGDFLVTALKRPSGKRV